jgi:hypothetical protein
MVKKAATKKPVTKKPPKSASTTRGKHENVFEHVAQELEARFLEGAEMATETTSAETNIALAALGAIEGPRDVEPKAKTKASHGKPKSARSKKR